MAENLTLFASEILERARAVKETLFDQLIGRLVRGVYGAAAVGPRKPPA